MKTGRRTFTLLVPCGIFGCGSESNHPNSLTVPRGNLVFISIDTTRADHLSVYGYHRRVSDTIRRHGTKMRHAMGDAPASEETLEQLRALGNIK